MGSLLLTVSTAPASWVTRVWPATTWPIVPWPPIGKSARTTLFAHTAPTPFLVLTAELRPHRRAASGTFLCCGWLGLGVQLCLHHPPGCEGEHGRQGAQGQTRVQLDGPVQDPGSRFLFRRRGPGWFAAREQPPLFGYPFRPARFGRSSACGHPFLQALRQPPRQRGHAQIPTGGADAVCAQQMFHNKFSKKSPIYHVTQDDSSNPLQRLGVEKITGHQPARGRGGVIAVLYKTHWSGRS